MVFLIGFVLISLLGTCGPKSTLRWRRGLFGRWRLGLSGPVRMPPGRAISILWSVLWAAGAATLCITGYGNVLHLPKNVSSLSVEKSPKASTAMLRTEICYSRPLVE
eukprot:1636252-Pyramimonas_sp.AAC.1